MIAKRTLASALATERLVYEKVMPGLPLESPEFYGYAEDGEKAWIFLEDVGDRRFSETDPEQRTAAARWLGAMHVSASELEVVQNLPKIGPDRYLDHLRSARGKIVDNLDNPALDRRDAELLAAVVGQLDTIEGSWPKLENLCDTIPNSLVHADFQSKNAYVRERDGVPGLLLIDWETAGMGPLGARSRADPRPTVEATYRSCCLLVDHPGTLARPRRGRSASVGRRRRCPPADRRNRLGVLPPIPCLARKGHRHPPSLCAGYRTGYGKPSVSPGRWTRWRALPAHRRLTQASTNRAQLQPAAHRSSDTVWSMP